MGAPFQKETENGFLEVDDCGDLGGRATVDAIGVPDDVYARERLDVFLARV